MSEKNVQSTQWTKSTIHKLNYDTFGTVAGLTGSIPNYGGGGAGGFATIPPHPPESLQESYGHVRFQPAITHHVVAPPPPPPPPTPTTVLMPLGAVSSNVPALSGFVPPYNASGSTNVTSAATSVLTPNPFAVHSSSGSSNVTFGLEQFQHLNAHQQFEFTKMMTAMNTAASFTSVTSTTATSISATPSGSLSSVQLSSGRQNVELTSTSGTITSTIAENVLNAIRINSASMHNQGRSRVGVKLPDEDKLRRIQHLVESGIGDQAKQQVLQILDRISTLKPVEKLVLYLRMPAETPDSDPLRHPQNPLGTRSEISHTINWVRSHLEHDPQVSIPKQDVYNDYITFCDRLGIKPLSTADFGKVMKQVFPEIRPRRLGTRGNSRYCYAAMRKTTKLTTPQLPQLGTNFATKSVGSEPPMKTSSIAVADSSDCLDTSWQIVKMWAEKQLNIKVENINSLAAHIQANHLMAAGSAVVQGPLIQKKISQREPKEKRPTGDFGPLKKRRKKKRKGSSSSESSCNQPQSNRAENSTKMSPVNTRCASSINMSEDEKKSIELIEVKQEVMDSPGYHKAPSTQRMASPNLQPASITVPSAIFSDANKPHSYNQKPAHSPLQHSVQQLLPMNLATDSRTTHARAPPFTVGLQNPPINSTAVKNITPKIMDLSSPATSQPPSAFGTTCVNEQVPIKEEVIDDYNPTNVFCKKVLKAQQTKGFWSNSPTPSTTITAASPSISVIAATSAIAIAGTSNDIVSSQTASYLMGPPPAQISTSTSPSAVPTEGSSIAAQPKVSSLNMMQLRAKKLRYYQIRESIAKGRASPSSDQATSDSTTEIDKDTDLPENLGLPRERVISICNMDKHELDDYFLPGEEENSQDQEAELLQYFQTGDAEEKPNSLDAAKTCNPTALHLPSLNNDKEHAAGAANSYRPRGTQTHSNKVLPTDPAQALVANEGVTRAIAPGNINLNSAYVVAGTPPTHTPAVGSASASLALMSQKHQHQQQNKRKINVNTMMMIDNMTNSATRKNCIFLPISPNINNTTLSVSASTAASHSVMNGSDFFASPGLTRFRSKPAVLCKQQSLDCDMNFNSDPMICASRRRKSTYGASHPTILTNTSASAPPSPSVLQHKQQVFGIQQQLNNSQWHITPGETSYTNITNHDSSLLVEQNSIDLDLFNAAAAATGSANHSFEHDTILDAAAAANSIALTPFSETQQRSQSVPLSQLQRIHSPAFNRNFQTNFSTCTSVAQTPVPSEFADFNMFCENSQHASSACTKEGSIKLETVGVLETDASAILDEVDVSDILSLPDFVSKFSNVVNSSNAATTTTCSSAGSSSGYSSGACTVFGVGIANSIISRSVPSTPLPHQQQYLFGGGGHFYDRQRPIDEIHLSPTVTAAASAAGSLFTSSAKNISSQLLSRAAYDISKSMPTTPITTPRFRYSPVEFHRDFLINGNTIDSITSLPTMNVLNTDTFMNGGDLDVPNAEALIDDGSAGVSSNAFTAAATDAANSRMVVRTSSFKEAASGLQVQHKTESRIKEFRLFYCIVLYLFIEPLKYYIYIFT